jgi:hypothetical protein
MDLSNPVEHGDVEITGVTVKRRQHDDEFRRNNR